jgi:hypothetical protein
MSPLLYRKLNVRYVKIQMVNSELFYGGAAEGHVFLALLDVRSTSMEDSAYLEGIDGVDRFDRTCGDCVSLV